MNNVQNLKTTTQPVSVMQEVDGGALFENLLPQGLPVPQFIERNRHVPTSNSLYFPDPKVFRAMMKWMMAPKRQIGFGLWGETRTGKTEMVRYIADKLNWPLRMVSCHADLRPYQLEGQNALVDSPNGVVTQFKYAAAAEAYRDGHILLLDEVDKLSPDVTAKLHLLIEGKPWPIDETGEVIEPHPNFRIVGTANTCGSGDSDLYLSSQRMDQAFRRRWGWVKTDFLSKEVEVEIILKVTDNKLPRPLVMKLAETAEAMREMLTGDAPISTVVGTGTLTQWAEWILNFGKKSTIQESFDFLILNGCDDDEKDSIERAAQLLWGDSMSLTLGEWLQGK